MIVKEAGKFVYVDGAYSESGEGANSNLVVALKSTSLA